MVAGQLIEEVSGQTWEAFVRERVFKPAGMDDSVTDSPRASPPQPRVAARAHRRRACAASASRGCSTSARRWATTPRRPAASPSSANDMAQLAAGATRPRHVAGCRRQAGQGLQRGAQSQRDVDARGQLMPSRRVPGQAGRSDAEVLARYALGWNVRDYRGAKIIDARRRGLRRADVRRADPGAQRRHSSCRSTPRTAQVMRGIAMELLDHYLGAPKRDWVAAFDAVRARRGSRRPGGRWSQREGARRVAGHGLAAARGLRRPLRGPWYGPIDIRETRAACASTSRRRRAWSARWSTAHYDTFRAVWDDPNIEPAYVTFALDAERQGRPRSR